jgi:hypothetical protein
MSDDIDPKNVHSAEDVRGGQIVLDTPARRWIFIAGLVALILLGVTAPLFLYQ